MQFLKALRVAFLASALYRCVVGSTIPTNLSTGIKRPNDGHVNLTAHSITHSESLQKRQGQAELRALLIGLDGIIAAYANIHPRELFTAGVVEELHNLDPHYNYIICDVDHEYNFQGIQGVDWAHKEVFWNSDLGGYGEVGYDLVVGGAGTFSRYRDGGFINWAYSGYVVSRVNNKGGSTVTFSAPPSS